MYDNHNIAILNNWGRSKLKYNFTLTQLFPDPVIPHFFSLGSGIVKVRTNSLGLENPWELYSQLTFELKVKSGEKIYK